MVCPDETQTRDELVESYLPLVRAIARKIYLRYTRGADLDDYVQDGCVGLLRAVAAFDASRGTFGPWARLYIHQAIIDGIRAKNHINRSAHAFVWREVAIPDETSRVALSTPSHFEEVRMNEIRAEIRFLRPQTNRIMTRVYVEGWSVREAANEIPTSEANAYQKLHFGFKHLRKHFGMAA